MMRYRQSAYAPFFAAILVASFLRVGVVINQYFPAEWFRYIVTAAGIVVVSGFLFQLIRRATSPRPDWLLKQYRQAYNQHRCPLCAYPILRGALKHAQWTSRGPKFPTVQPAANADEEDKPYSCPSCGGKLFEPCESCGAIRHALLPYCNHCGNEKPIANPTTG
jgi:predicted RNA-binding Zn-ribbon protein involved in translation (DUF1610 family)